MEVIAGPTFSIEVSPPSYIHERRAEEDVASRRCMFLDEEEGVEKGIGSRSSLEASSESSSSIGAQEDSDGEEEEEEDDAVSSKAGGGGIVSLIALDDALPIKRGLSNHFSGKSKSFADLSSVSSVKELEKGENPFNKRRRVLMANKFYMKKSSFYSWQQNPKSMPLLALNEQEDDRLPQLLPSPSSSSSSSERVSGLESRMKSQSCYSLADLHEEDQP